METALRNPNRVEQTASYGVGMTDAATSPAAHQFPVCSPLRDLGTTATGRRETLPGTGRAIGYANHPTCSVGELRRFGEFLCTAI
jgi:hypothetical protein